MSTSVSPNSRNISVCEVFPLLNANNLTTTQRATTRSMTRCRLAYNPLPLVTQHAPQQTTIFGNFYSIDEVVHISLPFRAIINEGRPLQVNVTTTFSTREPLSPIICTIVHVEGIQFLIYGYTNPHPSPTNDLLQSLKPSTLWHGEIAVFILGKHVPLLFHPQNVKHRKHILAIRLYVQMPYFVLLDLFMFTFIKFPFPRQ